MGLLEDQARFFVAKYGTAAGPSGLPHSWPGASVGIDLPTMMVVLGMLIFLGIVLMLYNDWQRTEAERRETYDRIYG